MNAAREKRRRKLDRYINTPQAKARREEMEREFDTGEPIAAPACDHEWKFNDDSFDHEFGTERIHSWQCEKCGEVTNESPFGDSE